MTNYRRDQPRPLILQFYRWGGGGGRMDILTNEPLRYALRWEGIRITSDLTERQQKEVQVHRQQGKLAYCKNGQLHISDRQPARSTQNNRHYSDQDPDFAHNSCSDWPRPQRRKPVERDQLRDRENTEGF
ncbi:hypothetical protein ACOMHN_051831 [Nucella lapillus]